MSIHHDWYIYHSPDGTNWLLQEGGPYSEDQALKILEEDEAKRQEISRRVARVQYPQGAIPDKRIERTGLDLANQNKELQ
jgi:hypothetical protein